MNLQISSYSYYRKIWNKKALIFLFTLIFPLSVIPQSKAKKFRREREQKMLTYKQRDLIKKITYTTDGQYFTDDEIIKINNILQKIEFSNEWKEVEKIGDYYSNLTKSERIIFGYQVERFIQAKIDSCVFADKDESRNCSKIIQKHIQEKGKRYFILSKKDKKIYRKIRRRKNRVRFKLNRLMKKKLIPKNKVARKQYKKNLKKANEFNKLRR